MLKGYLIAVGFVAAVLLFIANAAFALSNPRGWVRSRWTARRGLDPETSSDGDIRAFGVFFALAAIGWGWVTVKLLYQITGVTGPIPTRAGLSAGEKNTGTKRGDKNAGTDGTFRGGRHQRYTRCDGESWSRSRTPTEGCAATPPSKG
jgi:hypothetical protein